MIKPPTVGNRKKQLKNKTTGRKSPGWSLYVLTFCNSARNKKSWIFQKHFYFGYGSEAADSHDFVLGEELVANRRF